MSAIVKVDIELQPLGQLDTFSAELLTQQLENSLEKGARNIVVNAKQIFPFLPAAMGHIRNFIVHDLYVYSPFSISFININKRCLETFPANEYPYIGDRTSFQMPQYADFYFKGGAITICNNCGATLHIQKKQKYLCPHCGTHFKIEN